MNSKPEHNEDDERRNIAQPALQIGQRDRHEQRQDKDEAVAEVGDKALHSPEVESREDVADEEKIERPEERAKHRRPPASQARAAKHKGGDGNERIGRALGGVAGADEAR